MEIENGLNRRPNMHDEAATLKDSVEAEKSPDMIGDEEDLKKSKEEQNTKTVPFLKLFSFADSRDVFLMIVGTIGAIGNGLGLPLMTIFFGEMINVLGFNQNNQDVVRVVSKVKLCSTSLTFEINFHLCHWKVVAEHLVLF
jgi:ATP-binding cassette subfamily B (MDR/TAP) protein 1